MLRTSFAVSLGIAALAAIAPAQVTWPDDAPRVSSGNLSPLGFLGSNPNFDEARYQILIPARSLPSTGALLTSLSVAQPAGPATITYGRLTITMSLTSANALTSNFNANLVSPIVVYNATGNTEQFTTNDWSPGFTFQQPFPYDGVSNVVVEFQKVIDRVNFPLPGAIATHATNGNTARNDLPRAFWGFTPPGGGGATLATAQFSGTPLKVRLGVARLSTLQVGSERGGANNNIFAIGAPFRIRFAGTPGDQFAHVLTAGFLPGPVTIPPVLGGLWVDLSISATSGSGILGASGEDIVTLTLPSDPGLVGALLGFQGIWLNSGGVLSWTNAADAFINS